MNISLALITEMAHGLTNGHHTTQILSEKDKLQVRK